MKARQSNLRLKQCFKGEKQFQRPPNPITQRQKQSIQRFLSFKEAATSFSHHYLYCLDTNKALTVSEQKILNNERNKYISFVTRNFKYKIPQQFTDKKILKEKRRLLNAKIKNELEKKKQEEGLKPLKRKRIAKLEKVEPKAKNKQKAEPKAKTLKKKLGIKQQEKEKQAKKGQDFVEQEVDGNEAQQSIQAQSNHFESQENLQNDELDQLEEEDL